MIVCSGCGKQYKSNVTPLRCKCGVVTGEVQYVSTPPPKRNHWATLHEYAYHQPFDEEEARAFVVQWQIDIARQTSRGCGCAKGWGEFGFKFCFDSSEAFQESTVDGHNLVRAKLGQSQFTYDQSRHYWTGPRVAFLSASYLQTGGTEIFHRTLIPRLREKINVIGFAATAFTGGQGALLKVPYSTGEAWAIELAQRADVVVSWGIDDIAKLLPSPRPKVISVHHSDMSSDWSNGIQKQVCIDRIVAVNRDVAEQMGATHIANCVDPERIRPRKKADTHGKRIVLFAHRLAREKRPMLAAQIAEQLPDGWQMVVIGSGELSRELKQTDKLKIVGPLDTLADWLVASDRFLSLATFEGYGLSVAEALAAGVPVVSTDTGIASGRALTLPVDASVGEWVSAILTDQPRTAHSDLCDVDRFVDQWERVIRCVTLDR